MIFQLTITITVDVSVDNNNCSYTQSADKMVEEEVWVGRLYGLTPDGGARRRFIVRKNESVSGRRYRKEANCKGGVEIVMRINSL